MNLPLTIIDPLANQAVTIIITLATTDVPLAERPLLLSVGVAEQLPVAKTGTFANLMPLIEEAWTALGVRVQVANAAVEEETIAEEQTAVPDIVATQVTNRPETTLPAPNPLSAPQPQAQNLSLF